MTLMSRPACIRWTDFSFVALHLVRRERAARLSLAARNLDQLAIGDALFEFRFNLRQPRFAHRVPQRIAQQSPLIDHRRALDATLPRIRHGTLGNAPRTLRLNLHAPPPRGLGHHPLRLISMLGGEFLMLRPDLLDAQRLLGVPRPVRGDLRRSSASSPLLGKSLFDLLTPRTRCLKILLRVAFDLRLTMRAALDFIAQPLQVRRQLRAVNRRRVLLRLVKFLRLQRPRFALRRLRYIEDHRVRVQLRRGVTIDRTAAVVLEPGHRPRARRLRRSVASDARLRVLFHLVQSHAHALPMGLSHAIVAADKRRQRYRFRRRKRRVPPARCSIARTVSPCAFTYSCAC